LCGWRAFDIRAAGTRTRGTFSRGFFTLGTIQDDGGLFWNGGFKNIVAEIGDGRALAFQNIIAHIRQSGTRGDRRFQDIIAHIGLFTFARFVVLIRRARIRTSTGRRLLTAITHRRILESLLETRHINTDDDPYDQ
jgi:hypothetical protein